MLIYWLLLLFIVLLTVISKVTKDKYSNLIFWIFFIATFILLAIRDSTVGADTKVYSLLFLETKEITFWNFNYSRQEKGYLLLNKLLSFIENPQVFIAIIAFIPLFIIFIFIKKESKIPWLSVYLLITLGFYADIFNLFRQMIAMSFLILSYKYLKADVFWKFLLCVLTAALFHISSLVFIIVYIVRYKHLSRKNVYIYSIISLLLLFFSRPLIDLAIKLFATRSDIILKSNGGIKLLLVLIITLIAGCLFYKSVISINKDAIILYNILIIAIFAQIISLEFSLFTRITNYFMFFLIIFIPEVLSAIRNERLRKFGILLVVILTAVQFYISFISDYSGLIPYRTFF